MNKNNFTWFKPSVEKKNYINELKKLINKDKMTMGLSCQKLEKKLKNILKVKHVILTTSGTSALMMATIALNVNSKSKVICTNMTWIATINPAKIMGSKILLIDTEKNSLHVSFSLLNKNIKKYKPDLVYLVHLNGVPTYNKEFESLKKKFKFSVIEDAAQCFPVKVNKKSFCGTLHEIGCFSLGISKLTNMIYGGFCVTNSDKLADKLFSIRNNGVNASPENAKMEVSSISGLNLKPSNLHASIGLVNLSKLNSNVRRVKDINNLYVDSFKDSEHIEILNSKIQKTLPIYILAIVKNRKNFINYCKSNNIELHYNLRTLSETNLFDSNKNLDNSLFISKNVIRLPSGPGYKMSDVKKIINLLKKYKS